MTNETTACDELAELASLIDREINELYAPGDDVMGEDLAVVLHAAGYRKPRTITTVEELDALATESIVRDVDGLPKEKQNGTGGEVFWAAPGHRKHYGNGDIWLPATVLYEPTPGGVE